MKNRPYALATIIAFHALRAFAGEISAASENLPNPSETEKLRAEIDALRARLDAVEKQPRSGTGDVVAKTPDSGTFNFDENGFRATSADKNFQLRIRGLIQTDARVYFDRDDPAQKTSDSFILRRARPIIEATVAKDYDAVFVPEFGGSYGIGAASSSVPAPTILDAYLNAKIAGDALQLRIGKFKSPIGLDLLQEDANRPLIESAFPTYLVPNRDVGLQLHGTVAKGVVEYRLGVFNGTSDGAVSTNAPDFSDNKTVAGRLFFTPFASSSNRWIDGLGFGIAGDFADKDGGAANTDLTTGYKTDGSQTFFTYNGANTPRVHGDIGHIAPQASWYVGPFSLLAEYIFSDARVTGGAVANRVVNVNNRAWQVTVGYVLTGEDASFKGVKPGKPVTDGGCGAFEIVVRASQLYIDDDVFSQGLATTGANAKGAKSYALGLNWYLSRNLRVSADYTHTDFDSAATTSPLLNRGEDAVLMRAQIAF